MKTICRSICLAGLILLGTHVAFAQSNVYSLYIVGYVNTAFRIGDTLFGNPLQNTDSLLSTLIPNAPDGTMVSLWNPSANGFIQTSTFASGSWSDNFTLNPGHGAKLTTSTAFTNTFVGTVLAPNGAYVTNEADILIPPPIFAGPPGNYLLSCKTPFSLNSERSAFSYILGRAPVEGEQFTTLDPTTQLYHTTTFTSGAWDNGDPLLGVGEAAFFNIGPSAAVPEPSVAGLMIVGLCLARVVSRRS